MKFILVVTIFIFASSSAQTKAKVLPLTKIIRNVISPDSNTVIVLYDTALKVTELDEYIKQGEQWKLVEKIKYLRDKNSRVIRINWDDSLNNSGNNILKNNTDEIVFFYDDKNRVSGSQYRSKNDFHSRFDYNNDGLIIREVFLDKYDAIWSYKEYSYDKYGGVDSTRLYDVEDLKAYLKNKDVRITEKDIPTANCNMECFLINEQNCQLYAPFSRIGAEISFTALNTDYWRVELNKAGYWKTFEFYSKNGNKGINYQFNYITSKKVDFTWEQYLADKAKPAFIKKVNLETIDYINPLEHLKKKPSDVTKQYPPLDLRNGVPYTQSEILQMEKTEVLNTGSGVILPATASFNYAKPYDATSLKSSKFVLIFSRNKSYFNIVNQSVYPFIIHISNCKDVFLPSQTGIVYSKSIITDSSKIQIEYPDTNFIMRHKSILFDIKKFGGQVDNMSSHIDSSLKYFLNRETVPSPTVEWIDETGNIVRVDKPDPIADAVVDYGFNIAAIWGAQQAKDNLIRQRQLLQTKLINNETVYAASKGDNNKFKSNFDFLPLKHYIEIKLKDIK